MVATVFWDSLGIILSDYLDRGKILLLGKLKTEIAFKNSGLAKKELFHKDIAPVYKCAVSIDYFEESGK